MTPNKFAIGKFCIQVLISLIVLFFAISMLLFRDGSTEVYLPVITGITAYWLPQPTIKHKNNDTNEMVEV